MHPWNYTNDAPCGAAAVAGQNQLVPEGAGSQTGWVSRTAQHVPKHLTRGPSRHRLHAWVAHQDIDRFDRNIEDNLVVRAAKAVLGQMRVAGEWEFRLDKRIPMDGGLSGGSSNAAAVLLAMPALAGKGSTASAFLARLPVPAAPTGAGFQPTADTHRQSVSDPGHGTCKRGRTPRRSRLEHTHHQTLRPRVHATNRRVGAGTFLAARFRCLTGRHWSVIRTHTRSICSWLPRSSVRNPSCSDP